MEDALASSQIANLQINTIDVLPDKATQGFLHLSMHIAPRKAIPNIFPFPLSFSSTNIVPQAVSVNNPEFLEAPEVYFLWKCLFF